MTPITTLYRFPHWQWHLLQWNSSDSFWKSQMAFRIIRYLWLQWHIIRPSAYSDTLPMYRRCHCCWRHLYSFGPPPLAHHLYALNGGLAWIITVSDCHYKWRPLYIYHVQYLTFRLLRHSSFRQVERDLKAASSSVSSASATSSSQNAQQHRKGMRVHR